MKTSAPDKMDKLIALCRRRGFIFPGSEIYGGLANTWDFGPLGVELKNNLKQRWWQKFVQQRSDMLGLDAALLMNTKVWETSGHLAEFTDPLVECKKCHGRFRADQLTEAGKCPTCGGGLSEPRQFNLMLKTSLGAVDEAGHEVYFRPETAQGIFVNFKNIVDTMRPKLPFGVGQIGKAFRNEITPGNFIFRTREFEQMEVEYFFAPPADEAAWRAEFSKWLTIMRDWITDLGIDLASEIVEFEQPAAELAHYSKRTVDFEYEFPFGRKELFGLAYRGDFDLRQHGLSFRLDDNTEVVPHVIEPSLGVERALLAALLSAYREDVDNEDGRIYLALPSWLAPIKVAVFPLLRNKPEQVAVAQTIFQALKIDFVCQFDDNGNVGKRYRRQDEIGTPFCVTVDFDSLDQQTVTVRERDTMEQSVVAIADLSTWLRTHLVV